MIVSPSRLQTLRDYIRWAVSRFHEHEVYFGHGTDNAWDEARLLVLGGLHLPWAMADAYLDCRLEEAECLHLNELLSRRIEERVPAAYLLGEAWFCGLPFIVDERVLVPRSPIAEYIERQFAPWLPKTPARILDLCTGSGCIGIACAYEFPDAEVVLADLSYDALEVANLNIEQHELEGRVYTVQSDGFDGLPGQRFDLIVSNPPYVDLEDFASMPDEYQHEPSLAWPAVTMASTWSGVCSPRPPTISPMMACWWSRSAIARSTSRRCTRRSISPGWNSSAAVMACSCWRRSSA